MVDAAHHGRRGARDMGSGRCRRDRPPLRRRPARRRAGRRARTAAGRRCGWTAGRGGSSPAARAYDGSARSDLAGSTRCSSIVTCPVGRAPCSRRRRAVRRVVEGEGHREQAALAAARDARGEVEEGRDRAVLDELDRPAALDHEDAARVAQRSGDVDGRGEVADLGQRHGRGARDAAPARARRRRGPGRWRGARRGSCPPSLAATPSRRRGPLGAPGAPLGARPRERRGSPDRLEPVVERADLLEDGVGHRALLVARGSSMRS